MAYIDQWHLTYDDPFVSRTRACLTQQAMTYKDDGRADIATLAHTILTGTNAGAVATFMSVLGMAPGFAAAVTETPTGVSTAAITDNQILAAVQANWPVIAGLFYNIDGTAKALI